MKKLFILALTLIGFNAQSQTVDSAFKSMTACKIQPFKVKWNDTVNVDHLGVNIKNDNLSSSATFYWALMDSTGLIHIDGYTTIINSDYTNWNGNNIFPFSFIGKKLNLVFIKPD